MDKNSFSNAFSYEDKIAIANLYDKMELADRTGKITFSIDFFPPSVWQSIIKMERKLGVKVHTSGIFEEGERRIIAFDGTFMEDNEIEYPIKLLKITNKSKFDQLEHKDYLGALMAIGIKREKYGDMIVEGNICYVPACNDAAKFIADNLEQIGRAPCEVSCENFGEIEHKPQYKFEEEIILAASLRIDAIVASICNLSRNDAVGLIEESKVQVNYEVINDKDHTLKLPCTIAARKYGKYKVEEVTGSTQKGRMKILVKKYI